MNREEQYQNAKGLSYRPESIDGFELNKIQMICKQLGCGENAYNKCVTNVAYRDMDLCTECKDGLKERYTR